jgi:hypothetical protein
MRRRPFLFMLFVALAVSAPAVRGANAQAKSSTSGDVLETVEWTWAEKPVKPDSALPNVLLIGDSITRGYYPQVAKLLNGQANCYLFASSIASGASRLPVQLDAYFKMMDVSFKVVHFNNGMHGWGYTEKAYAAGLPGMIAVIRSHQPSATLIWATTTPVHKDELNGATNARIEERNGLALAIMQAQKLAVDDQHTLMEAHDDLHRGNVHYKDEGSAAQAQQVVSQLKTYLVSPASTAR